MVSVRIVLGQIMVIIFLSFLASNARSQKNGIYFENSLTWEQVEQKAKDENKYIFIDCYATWCGPCKEEMPRLQKDLFHWRAPDLVRRRIPTIGGCNGPRRLR